MTPFAEFAAVRTAEAERARIYPLVTLGFGPAPEGSRAIGNEWTRRLYDGPFHLPAATDGALPAVSLVFVRSREGNTAIADPADLGGGATDKHLIYEGLSRVAADAVMAGAASAGGESVFFSLWHPEIIALRAALGLPRHPAQVVVTRAGGIDVERSRVFNVPEVAVYLLAAPRACERLGPAVRRRPWVRIVRFDGDLLRTALAALRRQFGIARISTVGGRKTATALLDERIVQDICLTTTERSGGEPGTPFYLGERSLPTRPLVTKRGTDPDAPFVFEHLMLETSSRSGTTRRR